MGKLFVKGKTRENLSLIYERKMKFTVLLFDTIVLFQTVTIFQIVYASVKTSQTQKGSQTDTLFCKLASLIFPAFQREDQNVNYLLFTRSNKEIPCDLQPTEDALRKCNFDPSLETKVIVHGWLSQLAPNDLKMVIKDGFLEAGAYNVVVFNWTSYTQHDSSAVGYLISSFSTFFVGMKIAAWVNYLQENTGVSPESFHFLPHSLGSEVVAFAGKATCSLGHITHLDPAGPVIRFFPSYLRPTYTDANFVEAIHTSGALIVLHGYGLLFPLADIDYYPNGGSTQPKCYEGAEYEYTYRKKDTVRSQLTRIHCNHYSVFQYYIASFIKSCEFLGLICNSYHDFLDGTCNTNNSIVCKMGYGSEKIPGLEPKSKCYLKTSDHPPYCLGIDGLISKSS